MHLLRLADIAGAPFASSRFHRNGATICPSPIFSFRVSNPETKTLRAPLLPFVLAAFRARSSRGKRASATWRILLHGRHCLAERRPRCGSSWQCFKTLLHTILHCKHLAAIDPLCDLLSACKRLLHSCRWTPLRLAVDGLRPNEFPFMTTESNNLASVLSTETSSHTHTHTYSMNKSSNGTN